MNPSKSPAGAPVAVLDTNAALDWLVFGDAGMGRLSAAIECGALRWVATLRMREELLRTLAYPALVKWKPDVERTLTLFDRLTHQTPEPARSTYGPLLCSDPDDQVFMDLAVAHGARWLITHDRALHKLARSAARQGVRVLRPGDWAPDPPTDTTD
jgi:predicted nucleic acid-binding protein